MDPIPFSQPAIDVASLTKRYDAVTALADVSFQVQAGEIVGFLGPNGAGKTTTLRILTGMLAPTAGTVRIDGLDVTERPLEVRRRIGYLPEHVALYPELRVQEYLYYRASIKGVPGRARREHARDAMERCAVTDVARQLIGRLSKGYRQRVALADCLLARPPILILDEPTVGLDPHQIRQTRELIKALGRSATILLSTHILPEVEMLCHRVAIIDKGRIVAVDTPAQLGQRLRGTQIVRVELRLPAAPTANAMGVAQAGGDDTVIESALRELPGVARVTAQRREDLPAPSQADGGQARQAGGAAAFEVEADQQHDIREAIFRLAVERRWALRELSQQRASLEEVFIHLTTREDT
ncbi:MAG: ATP-binding cassette domain-containing protein [Candidatus Omnitrophica bacterium]|nr:ATP-binding cassette domain-containing protein [Candidatus Omnitrophota bacterium]